jgi:hypothetical protein
MGRIRAVAEVGVSCQRLVGRLSVEKLHGIAQKEVVRCGG